MKYILPVLIILLTSCEKGKEESPCQKEFADAYYAKEKGKYELSLKHIEKYGECVLEGHPDKDMPYFYHKGWAEFELGKYQEAVDTFTLGAEVQNDYPFVYFRRGLAYEGLGNYEAAERDFKKTYDLGMSLDPESFPKTVLEIPEIKGKLNKYIELNKGKQQSTR